MKYFLLVLIFISSKARAQAYISGYSAPAATTKNIYALTGASSTAWYAVNNASTKNYFVPTKTATEWSAFSAHLPGSVTLATAAPQNCNDILGYGISAPSDNYPIYPVSPATPVTAYCEMTDDSGGWTRLNSGLASTTGTFGASDIVSGTNVGTYCGGPTVNFSVSSIAVTHSQMRFILVRSGTTIQCPTFTNLSSTSSYYQNGAVWTAQSTCTWQNPWTQSSAINDYNITGLPNTWKVVGSMSSSSADFSSQCSDAVNDNGTYNIQMYVK